MPSSVCAIDVAVRNALDLQDSNDRIRESTWRKTRKQRQTRIGSGRTVGALPGTSIAKRHASSSWSVGSARPRHVACRQQATVSMC